MGHFNEMKGPIGKFEYCGHGKCLVNEKPRHVRTFVMICGGSGITPIYQVFRAVMQDPEDQTKCVLDGNRLIQDIVCKKELDNLSFGNEHRCRVLHTLTKAPDEWAGLRGRITGELVEEYCSQDKHKETLVLICGPEALEKSMHIALRDHG
jgi:nitrate reductase (NAD(P)H)